MTEYLNHCESVTTKMSNHRLAMDYILEEFRSDLTELVGADGHLQSGGIDVIKKMFEKSGANMRMYGSPQELAENIKIFKNFPGSQRYFKNDLEPYFTTPIIYQSLKNQKFICKSDLFVMLQSMIVRAFGNQLHPLVLPICVYLLKSNEKRVERLEFVPFDKKVFDEIWREIQTFQREIESPVQGKESMSLLMQESKPSSHKDRFKRLKSYIPNEWNEDQSIRIKTILSSPSLSSFDIACSSAAAKLLTRILQKSIDKRPEMFHSKGVSAKPTVRLFEDGDKKFVMKAELFNALKLTYDCDSYIETIPFEEVLRGFELKSIEFIRYPIQRSKHRAVPIQEVRTGEFCILAVDGLFEQLRRLIFGHRVFQKYQSTDWEPLQVLFDSLEKYFNSDFTNPYFLGTAAFETMELACKTQLARFEIIPTKTIRSVKADGFTVQNLKNELVYWNLTTVFLEIQDHAEVVYDHVDKVKKEKYLRTCDMYDALEYCQLICFFKRHPNYKKFLHNQGGCGRVPGLNCDFCVKIKPSKPVTIKTTPSETHTKEIEQLKIKISSLEAENSQLKQEGSSEISKLRNQLKTEQEKSKKIEDDLVKKAKEILEIEVGNINLNAENEANKKVKEQLLEKFSKLSVGSDH